MASGLGGEGTRCLDGLLWIGQTYPKFFCGQSESCVRPERPQGPHCFVHEAEQRGVSRRLSAMPPWVVPGQSRIFLVHRGGEKEASKGRIFGYFVVNRTEVLTPPGEKAPDGRTSDGPMTRPPALNGEPSIRTERCWNGETIVTHRYDAERKRWVRTGEECPEPPEPDEGPEPPESGDTRGRPGAPEPEEGDMSFAESDQGERIATHVFHGGQWHPTGAGGSERISVEDEELVEHRGCSIRHDPGAVYVVDGLAAEIADAFADRLDGGSIRRRHDVPAGRRLFNGVVDEVVVDRASKAWVPSSLRGKATVRGELVLFNDPPLFEKQPRASFRSLAHIDGGHLLAQIAAEVPRPSIRACRHRAGVTTQQEVIAVLAERSHANKAFARQLLGELAHLAREELDEFGEFRLPGMGTLKRGKDGRVRFRAYKALK